MSEDVWGVQVAPEKFTTEWADAILNDAPIGLALTLNDQLICLDRPGIGVGEPFVYTTRLGSNGYLHLALFESPE